MFSKKISSIFTLCALCLGLIPQTGYMQPIPQETQTTSHVFDANVTKTAQVVESGSSISINEGETIEYTISYQNTGNQDLLNVMVTDPIPAETCYVVGSIDGSIPTGTVAEFSNDSQASWTYTPTADGDGNDCTVTDLRIRHLNDWEQITDEYQEDFNNEFTGTIDTLFLHSDELSVFGFEEDTNFTSVVDAVDQSYETLWFDTDGDKVDESLLISSPRTSSDPTLPTVQLYTWTGTTWQKNTQFASIFSSLGISQVGAFNPIFFDKDLDGNNESLLLNTHPFEIMTYNSGTWSVDTSFNSTRYAGSTVITSRSPPIVFERDTISGGEEGGGIHYKACVFISFANPVNIIGQKNRVYCYTTSNEGSFWTEDTAFYPISETNVTYEGRNEFLDISGNLQPDTLMVLSQYNSTGGDTDEAYTYSNGSWGTHSSFNTLNAPFHTNLASTNDRVSHDIHAIDLDGNKSIDYIFIPSIRANHSTQAYNINGTNWSVDSTFMNTTETLQPASYTQINSMIFDKDNNGLIDSFFLPHYYASSQGVKDELYEWNGSNWVQSTSFGAIVGTQNNAFGLYIDKDGNGTDETLLTHNMLGAPKAYTYQSNTWTEDIGMNSATSGQSYETISSTYSSSDIYGKQITWLDRNNDGKKETAYFTKAFSQTLQAAVKNEMYYFDGNDWRKDTSFTAEARSVAANGGTLFIDKDNDGKKETIINMVKQSLSAGSDLKPEAYTLANSGTYTAITPAIPNFGDWLAFEGVWTEPTGSNVDYEIFDATCTTSIVDQGDMTSNFDITALDESAYQQLCIKIDMSKTVDSPTLDSWKVTYTTDDIETNTFTFQVQTNSTLTGGTIDNTATLTGTGITTSPTDTAILTVVSLPDMVNELLIRSYDESTQEILFEWESVPETIGYRFYSVQMSEYVDWDSQQYIVPDPQDTNSYQLINEIPIDGTEAPPENHLSKSLLEQTGIKLWHILDVNNLNQDPLRGNDYFYFITTVTIEAESLPRIGVMKGDVINNPNTEADPSAGYEPTIDPGFDYKVQVSDGTRAGFSVYGPADFELTLNILIKAADVFVLQGNPESFDAPYDEAQPSGADSQITLTDGHRILGALQDPSIWLQ